MPDYPTLDKTWQYNVNQAIAAQGSFLLCNENLLYQIVKLMTTGAGFSSPWQVRGSSNSSTSSLLALSAAGPGTGWTSGSSVTFNASTSPHSWIVLRNTALAPTAAGVYPEILLACSINSSQSINIWTSPSAGFTGGSITADPTATDMVHLSQGSSNNIGFGGTFNNAAKALHMEMSSDGQCTRMWVYESGTFQALWLIDRLKTPVSTWITPWVFYAEYLLTNLSHTGNWQNISSTYGGNGASANPAFIQFYWTGEGIGSGIVPVLYNAPNDLNSEYPMIPIGVWASFGGGGATPYCGRHGMFYDLWWGAATLSTGQLYAGAAAHAFVQLTEVIFPWSGASVMNTS